MMHKLLQMLKLPYQAAKALNADIANSSLLLARFLTQMGSSKAENQFWRMGAAIALLGVVIAAASHLETLAMLISSDQPFTKASAYRAGIHGLLLFFVAHIGIGLWRGLTQKFER